VYRLGNVVTDEYEGQFSVKLNSTTTVEQVDKELEVSNDDAEITGALVDIQSGSGLIKRCPEEDCTRVLQNGRCAEHGEGDGEFDLRIKGVIDDGTTVQDVIFDREMTESLTGISLEKAQEMAMDALDTSVVAEEMNERLLGQYYHVTGPKFNRYVLADEVTEPEQPDHEAMLIKARSI
jgi:replication factor A1